MNEIRGASVVTSLQTIASGVIVPVKPPLRAHAHWREEVIVVYCLGRGKFSNDLRFINLQMDMYDLHGNYMGYQLGVHESLSTPDDLLGVPPPPSGPMGEPEGPVPHLTTKEWTKGVWTFADGSEIHAVGPALSHLVPLTDGSWLFMVATGQTIAHGTGRYEGAHGTKQATGSTYVPADVVRANGFPSPGLEFDAKTVETFRIVTRRHLASAPARRQAPEQPPADAQRSKRQRERQEPRSE